jgi:hypothetical protein
MTEWTEFPLVPRLPRDPDVKLYRRLNLIAALVIVALGVALALAPRAEGPSGPETASYGD